jgi:hypothetical protein
MLYSSRTRLTGNSTSMIGLCQEGKSSPDALGRSAGKNLSGASARVLASRLRFLVQDRTRLPFAGAAFLLPTRLSLCSRASLETNQQEHREPAPSPSQFQRWAVTCRPSWTAFLLRNSICC